MPAQRTALIASSLLAAAALVARTAPAATPCATPVEGDVVFGFTATRYTPGRELSVHMTAHQYSWGTHVWIEDTPPNGWTVVPGSLSPPGTIANGKVVWSQELDSNLCETFGYSVMPPAQASARASFTARVELSSDTNSQAGTVTRSIDAVACARPGSPLLTSPDQGQTLSATTTAVTLQWAPAAGATSYEVHFGTTTTPPLRQSTTATALSVPVSAGSTYYWQIVAVNACGTTASAVRTFALAACTPPGPVALVAPAQGATLSGTTVTLSWSTTSGADTYDVHLGTTAAPPRLRSVSATSLTETVAAGTYTWKVVARGACGSSASPERTFSTVAALPFTTSDLHVLGVARAPGIGGTIWRTDLEVCNLAATQGAFDIALLLRGQPNPTWSQRSFTLEPGRCMRYEDALLSLFGVTGAASFRISPRAGSVVASSRTYNLTSAGSFGALAPAQTAAQAITPGRDGRLIQLGQSATAGSGFRTNLALENLGSTAVAAEIDLHASSGQRLGTRTVMLGPYEVTQLTEVFTSVTAAEVPDGYAVVRTPTAGGALLAEASVIDNRTGDMAAIQPLGPGTLQAAAAMTVMLPGSVPMTLLRVRAGSFLMGTPETERGRQANEGPRHHVILSNDYFLGDREVTVAQWQAVMGESPVGADGLDHPVTRVSWDDIAGPGGFLDTLNGHLTTTGQPGAGRLRLPTEAEWEHAARAGSTTRFSFGDALGCADGCAPCAESEPYLWWCGNTSPPGTRQTGTKRPNAFGLRDMHGSVLEWVADWAGAYSTSPQTDPTGPTTGVGKVYRGGAFAWGVELSRSGWRSADRTTTKGVELGFRVACSP